MLVNACLAAPTTLLALEDLHSLQAELALPAPAPPCAGHDPIRAGEPFGGLRDARVLLVPRADGGLELVVIVTHPCSSVVSEWAC